MNKRLSLLISAVVILFILAVSLTLGSQLTEKTTSTTSFNSSVGVGMMGIATPSGFPLEEMAREMSEGDMMADTLFAPEPYPGETAGITAAEVDQKIIKTGSLRVVVDDVSTATTAITEIASAEEGFVQRSSVYERTDGTHEGSITIRVPSSRFEAVMESVKRLANVVETETISGQDVTEQFTDLEAQLRNAKAQEETFLSVLEKAETVEDILNVQRELGYIRAQIESLEGRMQYLENVTSYSTIDVYVSEEPSLSIPSKEFRPFASIREAAQALVVVGQQVIIGLIWLVIVGGGILLPLGLLVWGVVWLILKALKRSRTSRR